MEPRTERLSSCPKGTRLMGKGAGMKMQMPPLQSLSLHLCALEPLPLCFTCGKLCKDLSLASGPHPLYPCDFTAIPCYPESSSD